MNWHKAKRWGVALAVALLAACSDDGKDGTPDGGGGGGGGADRPGLGRSTAAPEGAPFALPAGLELETPTRGYSPEDPLECDDKYRNESYGHGDLVKLCLIFNNRTGGPITVTLPPGLIFVSRNLKTQNGLLTQRITIEVPAGERFFAPVLMYCANGPRQPSSTDDEYDLGPVTQYADFQELFTLLEGKEISRQEAGDIQVAVNHLQDGKGLNATDRAAISKM
ncbi:hypothetical protein [Corallococcus aberystwythensis]|uniref:Lipoprotein n=1 Tax=Corallococcus aberystwythensis TaxID=2316722 RepID=A0A3A8PRX4_9BACT|nr:hypothetical protein [Corallococcus aberystwythensis]RKH56445.1 hypothetical protein D7W81_33825 [Corallococcus aberystwythensis]